ncbi:FG-GAP repeat domain-containing protein [Desulfobulbus elongatus]|uniref:FG-GAP repeat domain-containing protein n=1 Tax=Desulfobulbus elongatus TaxID=53332 RepID=UPI0012FC50A4|nr:VCBS repeat-containing protein [Desulfobulbus elongatus]
MNVLSLRTPLTALHRTRFLVTFLLGCCMLFATAAHSAPATPAPPAKSPAPAKPQVIVLPFDVEIPGSYTYLRNGLASTLASRLAARANVAAIAQGTASERMAKSLKSGDHVAFAQQLRQSGADYLIIGSLAPKSNQFELTGYVFTQTSGQTPKRFLQSFNAVDDAMTAIDELAWDISGAVFDKPRPEMKSGPAQPGGTSAFQTAHPDRAYREGHLAGMTTGLEVGGPFELVNTFRSRSIPVETMDMNVGDLDGDGKEEIVLLTTSSLILYRNDDGQFRMLATVNLPNHIRYHSVTLGDVNKNGLQEIYISGSNQDLPDSSALEWNGKKMTFLFEHVSWYLRTMGAQGEEPVLIGQSSLSDDLGGSNIHQMTLNPDNSLTEGARLNLPKEVNIFDFVQADIEGGGSKVTIALGNNNRLQLYDTVGTLRWTSPDAFGASNNFFGTLTSPNNAALSEKETAWVRTRIVVADLDGDGINDILVGRNRLETVPFMPNLRYFDGGSLSALTWESNSLVRLWESRKIPGYIANYQVAGADKGSTEYRVYFAEAETSYPFVFWHGSSTYLNCYTFKVKPHSQLYLQDQPAVTGDLAE